VDERPQLRPFTPAVPVLPIFLDLPLIRDEQVQHAPFIAVGARPWPGTVGVFASPEDSGYALNTLIQSAATFGETKSILNRAPSGLRDNGNALRVELAQGVLASRSWGNVLNGANLAAIGDGSAGNWELIQFKDATLVAPNTYDLTGRLRGQAGSDGIMPDSWPEGSLFVLLNAVPKQIDLPLSARDLSRHYRVGPAARGYDDPSFVHLTAAFKGNGLRPYSPVHLRAAVNSGDVNVRWIRRTRIDGDSWSGFDVPVGEDREEYLIRVVDGGTVRREEVVTQTNWTYSSAMRSSDAVSAPYHIEIAQVSNLYGAGPFASIEVGS